MDAKRLLPVALIYFFVNSVWLAEGLLYTYFLTPIFVFWLLQNKFYKELVIASIVLSCFALMHLYAGVDSRKVYLLSFINLFLCVVSAIAAFRFFSTSRNNFSLLRPIILINFLLTLVSLGFLFVGDWKDIFWYTRPMFKDVESIPRLKMFTYEASYYSYLLAPLVIFACYSFLITNIKKSLPMLLMVVIPLILSFSFGVMASLVIAFPISLLFFSFGNRPQVGFIKKSWFVLAGIAGLLVLVYLIWPQMILFKRANNILQGADTSGRGRTSESFMLAWDLISNKDYWFGIGLGQSKIMGRQLMEQLYGIYDPAVVFRIPNSMAETLATFGIIGVCIKLVLQVFLFVKCKVYQYFTSVWLFLFLFIYQFTGSYLSNLAEWILWAMVFSNFLAKTAPYETEK